MGKLLERNSELARRCRDLSPLRDPIRVRLWEGNRAAVLNGKTPQGTQVALLKRSTLKRRKGSGPPRAPRWGGSRVVTEYVVSVIAGPGKLSFTGSWPGFPQVEYLDRGTRRMAARPTLGFRAEDLEWVRDQMRAYVLPWYKRIF